MQRKTLHKQYKKLGISAVRRIGFSFFAVILIGSILPMSHSVHSTSSYLDHLFVATSATCVTGLVTHVTASEYTLFGQIVIILLIQIGGLGFLTLMSMFFVPLRIPNCGIKTKARQIAPISSKQTVYLITLLI